MTVPNPEFNYKVAVFTITAKTNLHVGSGSQNYGIIDNLVQRDPLTGFPCIYSSSLKGAIREYFRHQLKHDATWTKIEAETFLFHVFGFDRSDAHENDETAPDDSKKAAVRQQPAKYRFLQADLLSLPVRSDRRLFYRTTCPYLILNLKKSLELYKYKLGEAYFNVLDQINDTLLQDAKAIQFDTGSSVLEDADIKADHIPAIIGLAKLNEIAGNELAIARDTEFAELISDFHLPVIARNNLTDGRSSNLWYEQVLPSETRFWFGVLYPDNDQEFEKFETILQAHPVQIGANASIGYGFCSIIKADWQDSPNTPAL